MNIAQTNLTEGSIGKGMIAFAIPLFIGNLFQQLYNTADALIVGRLLGNTALAAVSGTGSLIFLLVGFFDGIAVGSGVVISRYYGAKELDKMQRAIHNSIAFGLAASAILTVLGTWMTPTILRWMSTPEDVMDLSTKYIRVYFEGVGGLVMYNTSRGIMQAVGNSRDPLKYLIISSCVNVVLDLVFIGIFHLGVEGAAFATIISQFISVFLCMRKLMRSKESYKVSLRKIRFHADMMKLVLNYGLPAGFQNSVIAIANVVVQSNINSFGTMAVAGCGAYSKIEGFAFLPITSFNVALTTFVGQNLGAREFERTKKGAKFGMLCAVLVAEFIGLVIYITAPWLIEAFTEEPAAVGYGVDKARICALFFCLLACTHSFAAVLRGAGKAIIPMIAMLSFWCVIRVTFIKIAVPIFQTIDVVNWVYPLTWCLSTIFLGIYFVKADWIHAFEKNR